MEISLKDTEECFIVEESVHLAVKQLGDNAIKRREEKPMWVCSGKKNKKTQIEDAESMESFMTEQKRTLLK